MNIYDNLCLTRWYAKAGNKCHRIFDLIGNKTNLMIITYCGQKLSQKDVEEFRYPNINGQCLTCKKRYIG